MSDLNDLKQRVGHAVERLAQTQDSRRERQDMLFRLLAELEGKFDARREELTYCHSRIADLEKSNVQLSELLETVIETVEASYVDDASDPIVRAAALAANLVEQCSDTNDADKYAGSSIGAADMGDVTPDPPRTERRPIGDSARSQEAASSGTDHPSRPITPRQEAPSHHEEVAVELSETKEDDAAEVLVSPPGRPSSSANKEKEAGSDMSFDVISARELEYEERLDKEIIRFPPTVAQAVNAAKRSDIADERPWERKIADALAKVALAAENLDDEEPDGAAEMSDIPGIENTAEFEIVDVEVKTTIDEERPSVEEGNDSDPDVRALMARLKQAARKSSEEDDSAEDTAGESNQRRAFGTDDSSAR